MNTYCNPSTIQWSTESPLVPTDELKNVVTSSSGSTFVTYLTAIWQYDTHRLYIYGMYRSLEQWFLTFSKSLTPKLSNLLLQTPHKSTQIHMIPIFCPKSSEEQKKSSHLQTSNFSAQVHVKSKKKVITSADNVQFFCPKSKKRSSRLQTSNFLPKIK